jgi:hypothetical protein
LGRVARHRAQGLAPPQLSHFGLKMGQFDGATFVCLLQSL